MITLDQLDLNKQSYKFYHNYESSYRGKRPLTVRQTGKIKTWKRQPERFLIPVKYGLYESGYIANWNGWYRDKCVSNNAADWSLDYE